MVPLPMTSTDRWWGFQGRDIFIDIEYLRKDTRWSYSYYRTSVFSHRLSVWMVTFSMTLTEPNPVFKVMAFL